MEKNKKNPMDEMSDEQKEYEALELAKLLGMYWIICNRCVRNCMLCKFCCNLMLAAFDHVG